MALASSLIIILTIGFGIIGIILCIFGFILLKKRKNIVAVILIVVGVLIFIPSTMTVVGIITFATSSSTTSIQLIHDQNIEFIEEHY